MVKIDIKGFQSVELQRGGLTIRGGGHLSKAMQLITKDVMATGSGQGSVAATYVQIRSREPWLSQAVRALCEYHAGVRCTVRTERNSCGDRKPSYTNSHAITTRISHMSAP